jgi:hypothetical protein
LKAMIWNFGHGSDVIGEYENWRISFSGSYYQTIT